MFESLVQETFPFLPDTLMVPSLDYRVFHHELYRETLYDTLLSRNTLRSQQTSMIFPAGPLRVKTVWTRSVNDLSDLLQNPYAEMSFRPVSHAFDLSAQTRIGGWLIQPGLRFAFSGFSDTLAVTDFPVSKTAALNSYFFNLLPSTFGDTLPYRYQFRHYAVSCLAGRSLGDKRLFVHMNYSNSVNRLSEIHENTGDFAKIRGPRETLAVLSLPSLNIISGISMNPGSLLWLGYRYLQIPLSWEHTLFPDDPDTLEIVTLASGKTHYHSLVGGYRTLSGRLDLRTDISAGAISGDLSVSTPVMGYLFYILPISHQGDISGRMRYISGHVSLKYPFYAGRSVLTPRFELISARCWSNLKADAQLEFGLEDIHAEQDYIDAVHLASFGLSAQIPLTRELSFSLEADQLIPYIRRIYPEPLPPEPTDIRRYGGLSVSAGISMKW